MNKIRPINQQKNCPSCGAPVVSEICAYCGTATGLNTAEADMEYPVLECKEAVVNFWTVGFPMIFGVGFGLTAIILIIISIIDNGEDSTMLMGVAFILIAIGALFFAFKTLTRYVKVKIRGKAIRAMVYGYMDDNLMINDQPAQIVKLLLQTPNGPRFILYQLKNTVKPYGINDNIDIMVYKNCFMIDKKKETIQW